MAMKAKDIIIALNMVPHVEKGYYVETFRDDATTAEGRSVSTQIYYLLEGSEGVSNWHRVRDAVEVWHHYAGAPMRLSLSWNDGKPVTDQVLGKDLKSGERPQITVERDQWQHAECLGEYTLVGCTVAPGFEMEAFEMAEPGWEPSGAQKMASG